MTKLDAKYLNLGEGSKQVNSRVIPAFFIPENFVPVEVDGEGTDKLSALLKGIDLKLGSLITLSFTDQLIETNGITQDFQVTNPFDGSTQLDVFVNGVLVEENRDWKRNSTANQIYFIDDASAKTTIPSGAYIRIRAFDNGFGNVNEHFDGGVSYVVTTNPFDANTYLDVYVNGILLVAGENYNKNNTSNQITFYDENGSVLTLDGNARVFVRITPRSLVDQYITGGSDSISISQTFKDADRIDLFINGRLSREGYDYFRDSSLNIINIVDGSSMDSATTTIMVRLWI